MKISKSDFDKLYDPNVTYKDYMEIIDRIYGRFCEIVEGICKIENRSRSYEFEIASEDGTFDPYLHKDYISYYNEYSSFPEPFDRKIPTRWLWEDYEDDYTKQVADARLECESSEAEREARAKKLSETFESMKKSIRSKLSPEEIAYLNGIVIQLGIKI